ncbi:MAG: glycoside hydrolase family 13 protein [Lachnospiraceae bacterium]|nr:glycoside hydrolase family 13 protein [Lachnospiraceae bacterium]
MDTNHLFNSQKYMNEVRPVFSKRALYSDTTEHYVTPAEPAPYSKVKIWFRSKKNNIDRVFLVCKGQKQLMFKVASDVQFDYYEVRVQLDNEKISYYFEVNAGHITCYYDFRGVVKRPDEHYNFVIIPGFSTPEWAKGAVIYQLYVDRFYNGDPSNDVLSNEYQYIGAKSVKVEKWDQYPAQMDVRSFYGGDLQGVLDKMDYLEKLGVEVIYFNPLFVSPSNHKYDIQDYEHIDPHIGKIVKDEGNLLESCETDNSKATRYITRVTDPANLEASDALFMKLVEEAHRRGMRVILDGVFNHCGSFNKWLDRERIYENAPGYEKGAYISADSPYHDFFQFKDNSRFPYNPTYDGWWGHDTLPKLNYEQSRALEDYILFIGKKWVSAPYCADGWRLDVAADLGHSPDYNHKFWAKFRDAVKEANPNAIILAEHYGDTSAWLQGDQWDTIMNYDAFMEPVTWFLTGMEKHSDDRRDDLFGNAQHFFNSMAYHGASMSMPSWMTSMNELSNHDHSRFLTRTNHKVGRTNNLGPEAANQDVNKAVLREAVVIQMTWTGAPTVYYGDEAGLCGFTDPDNRRTYPWGNEDKKLIEFHRDIIKMHRENPEFRTGSLKWLTSDYNFMAYGRFTRDRQSVILVNNNDGEVTREISVWELGIPQECTLKRLIMTSDRGYDILPEEYEVTGGKVKVTMPRTSAMVLQHVYEEENELEIQKVRKNFLQF